MAMHRKGCTKIERIFGETSLSQLENKKGKNWNKVGMQYGELIVEEKLLNGKYLCSCSCGNYISLPTDRLRNTLSKCQTHCGCLNIKYQKDEHYFDIIDTEEKAYILGILATDGCIGVSTNKHKRIKITLKNTDAELLEKIKKQFKTDAPIKISDIHTKLPQGSFCNSKEATLNICSDTLCNKLKEYGIVPSKTYDLDFNFEKIPKKLIRHFIRGCVDGDGTFGIYMQKDLKRISYVGFRLVGNNNFLKNIKNILIEELNINNFSWCHRENMNVNISILSDCTKKNFLKIFRTLKNYK